MKVARTVNSYWFRDLEEIDDGVYELKSAKKRIKMNLPIQIGFFVYQYAKLRMLQFYYEVIDHFLDRSKYELLEMDTDSLYMALGGDSVDALVKPELREEFEAVKDQWFPRTDTKENAAYEKRTPGLFKVDWSGQGSLGSTAGPTTVGDKRKISTRVKESARRTTPSRKTPYLRVLKTNNKVLTYAQFRVGFSYFYPKRKVLGDGISTIPLEI